MSDHISGLGVTSSQFNEPPPFPIDPTKIKEEITEMAKIYHQVLDGKITEGHAETLIRPFWDDFIHFALDVVNSQPSPASEQILQDYKEYGIFTADPKAPTILQKSEALDNLLSHLDAYFKQN